ncbi:hypothetical protein HHK36_008105 [Tetracentron sinense]|uniref:Uncharacterized protein n=1 Tax=Tetracentron sinense TaxID=13715 RepID=A0A834ZEZ9_TETSI|nr:hypothetical protein HHK36_008105 [Tetracentron sinense]
MAKFHCLSVLAGRKKKYKGEEGSSDFVHYSKGLRTLQVKLEHPKKSSNTGEFNSTSFGVLVHSGIQGNCKCKVNVVRDKNPVGVKAVEAAYEGEDKDDLILIKRNFSGFDLQTQVPNIVEEMEQSMKRSTNSSNSLYSEMNDQSEKKSEKDAEVGVEFIQSGHVSDPGIGKSEFWASPKLKRSCSNLETGGVLKKVADQLPLSKFHSFEDLQYVTERVRMEVFLKVQGSPVSVMTPCSADRVILKKHCSSQVLPSRSKRLWWKLFPWSHRKLHKPWAVKPRPLATNHILNQQGGYLSDTLEPNQALGLGKLESPGSDTGKSRNNSFINNKNNQNWDNFHGGFSGLWPQNQWIAFSSESPSLTRVDEWVNSLETQPPVLSNDEDTSEEGIVFPPPTETHESPAGSTTHMTRRSNINISEGFLHAKSVIQSLNSSSTRAHITGMGLKVIPTISCFSSLRSINLTGNFIVHIAPGSLPKGLHTLNLSRNKIVAIEGLRELTRLRVLDLSYNRISRMGHGLSNCTIIKELYLAGNKISNVEGLHRLFKLTILDMSFNKISTANMLGQLVAHYSSLVALNLLGNPIQSNISDDQLRKAVSGLLPQLAYLNKQPINTQRAREVAIGSVAKATIRNNEWTSQRKAPRRVSQSGSSSSSRHRNSVRGGQKSRHMSKSQSHHHLPIKWRSSTPASSSR